MDENLRYLNETILYDEKGRAGEVKSIRPRKENKT
jgi:hypothetical protein